MKRFLPLVFLSAAWVLLAMPGLLPRATAAAGDLDLTFGSTGKVTTEVGPYYDFASAVAVQGDGKIVVAGHSKNATDDDFAVVRYNTNGILDSTFGSEGKVTTDFNGGNDYGNDLALQADGKIVVAGGKSIGPDSVVVVRYDSSGNLDPSFGGTGKVTTAIGTGYAAANSIAVQADGKIVVAGYCLNASYDFAVVRYNADGSLDTTFNGTGKVTTDFNRGDDQGSCVCIQGDGKILVGGDSYHGGGYDRVIVRYNPDGSLDTTFNGTGKVITGVGFGDSMTLQPDGKIVMAGHVLNNHEYDFVVERYLSDGSPDTTFNYTGRVETDVQGSDDANSVAVQSDGKILVVGESGGFHPAFSLVRYNADGSLDTSFHGTGKVTTVITSLSSGFDVATGVVVRPNGKIVVVGGSSTANGCAFAVARYLGGEPVNLLPNLLLPASPLVVEATSLSGAHVPFTVSASDEEDGDLVPTVAPVSGSTFPLGDTTVEVSATDSNGATVSGSFVVRVQDTTAPTIAAAPDGFTPLYLPVNTGGQAALPDYTAQPLTSDLVRVTSVTQVPVPGTMVGEGSAQITLTAHDAAGNTAELSFLVMIRSVTTSVLVMQGGEVPEAGTDARIPAGAKWGAFGSPSLTAGGMNAGWQASVLAPRGGGFHGIFSGPLDAPMLRLRTGEPATDAAGVPVPGVTFQSFREPVFAGDDFAVMATLKGVHVSAGNQNATGIWVGEQGALRQVARQGSAAPGAGSARFMAFTSLAMPTPGTVFFTARLSAPVTKDVGLWVWTAANGVKLALREGDDFSLPRIREPLKSFQALSSVKGSPGHARYDAELNAIDVLVTLPSGQAIGRVNANGQTQLIAASEYAFSPALIFGPPSSPGRGGLPCVLGTFPFVSLPGIPVMKRTCIYRPNDIQEYAGTYLAQTDEPAPGATPAKFKSFLDPVSGYDGKDQAVAFFAATLANAVRSGDTGLWAYGNELQLVALEGTEPSGAVGTKWASFTALSVLEGRGPMFTAKLASGTARVTTANDDGLWTTDSAGSLRLIFREGQEAVPGKRVRSFQVLGAVAGSPGQRRAWAAGDASAQVILLAFFTDGSSAILRVTVP